MTKQSICTTHRQIDDLIDDIGELKVIFNDKEALVDILTKMRVLLLQAMESGQKMEDRLTRYRLAIEDLGFFRDNNGELMKELNSLRAKVFELENLEECNTCEFGAEGTCSNCKGVEGKTTEISGKYKCDNYKRNKNES